MRSTSPVLRSAGILSALFGLLIPNLALAGEVTVRNCSTQGISFKVKSFNSNDGVKWFPSGSMTISANAAGRLSCATEECTIVVELPSEIGQLGTSGTNAYASAFNSFTVRSEYLSSPSKRHFCLRTNYLDNGKISNLTHEDTGATSCTCR